MYISIECPLTIKIVAAVQIERYSDFFSRVIQGSIGKPFFTNLYLVGDDDHLLYFFAVSDAIIVSEVEIFFKLILIFSSEYPAAL